MPSSYTSTDIYDAVEACSHSDGIELDFLVQKVLSSANPDAWLELAVSCPFLAERVQEQILRSFNHYHANRQTIGRQTIHPIGIEITVDYLASFLRKVKNTNPVPIQACFIRTFHRKNVEKLIDITISLYPRISLFATVALLHKCRVEGNISTYYALLCRSFPGEAPPMIEECLWNDPLDQGYILQVCRDIPGLDLDRIEELICSNWSILAIRRFCDTVTRDRGPARDLLQVHHVMES